VEVENFVSRCLGVRCSCSVVDSSVVQEQMTRVVDVVVRI